MKNDIEFLTKLWNGKYTYLNTALILDHVHYVAICPIHGVVCIPAKMHREGDIECLLCRKNTNRLYEDYLTEAKLFDVLKTMFPQANIEGQFYFEDNKRLKYDYCVTTEEHRFLVEFDGNAHYTKYPKTDIIKNDLAQIRQYDLIRIPYFVQLDTVAVDYYFGKYKPNKNWRDPLYPHGFILNSSNCSVPADFCYYGSARYLDELTNLPDFISMSIVNSFYTKKIDVRLENPLECFSPSLKITEIERLKNTVSEYISWVDLGDEYLLNNQLLNLSVYVPDDDALVELSEDWVCFEHIHDNYF